MSLSNEWLRERAEDLANEIVLGTLSSKLIVFNIYFSTSAPERKRRDAIADAFFHVLEEVRDAKESEVETHSTWPRSAAKE